MRYYSGFAESFYFAYLYGHAPFQTSQYVEPGATLRDCVARYRDLTCISLEESGVFPAPPSGPGSLPSLTQGIPTHHVLVMNNENRHKSQGIVRHGWSWPLPPRALALVGPGIYMSTPEFTYLQLATKLSSVPLALAGCSLCSSYYIDQKTGKLHERKPITSVEKIALFLDSAQGIRGITAARHSLAFIADGAESPQEVNMFLLMSLSKELGGRAITGLQFNYVIEPTADDSEILDRPDRKQFRIDLGRPESHKGAEYLGKHHDQTIDKDRDRLNALTALGESVLQVKYSDLTNPIRCERLASQLSRMLGEKTLSPTPSEQIARARLANDLFGPGRLEL